MMQYRKDDSKDTFGISKQQCVNQHHNMVCQQMTAQALMSDEEWWRLKHELKTGGARTNQAVLQHLHMGVRKRVKEERREQRQRRSTVSPSKFMTENRRMNMAAELVRAELGDLDFDEDDDEDEENENKEDKSFISEPPLSSTMQEQHPEGGAKWYRRGSIAKILNADQVQPKPTNVSRRQSPIPLFKRNNDELLCDFGKRPKQRRDYHLRISTKSDDGGGKTNSNMDDRSGDGGGRTRRRHSVMNTQETRSGSPLFRNNNNTNKNNNIINSSDDEDLNQVVRSDHGRMRQRPVQRDHRQSVCIASAIASRRESSSSLGETFSSDDEDYYSNDDDDNDGREKEGRRRRRRRAGQNGTTERAETNVFQERLEVHKDRFLRQTKAMRNNIAREAKKNIGKVLNRLESGISSSSPQQRQQGQQSSSGELLEDFSHNKTITTTRSEMPRKTRQRGERIKNFMKRMRSYSSDDEDEFLPSSEQGTGRRRRAASEDYHHHDDDDDDDDDEHLQAKRETRPLI